MRTYTAEEMPDSNIENAITTWRGDVGRHWLEGEGIKPERIEHFRRTAIRLLHERKILWITHHQWPAMMELILEEGRRTLFSEPEPEVDGWGEW